jgi:hypothetical protein
MNQKWEDSIKNKIEQLLTKIVIVERGSAHDESIPFVYSSTQGISFAHGFDVLQIIDDIRKLIISNSLWGDKVSENHAGNRMVELIRTLLDDPEPTHRSTHFTEFFSSFPGAIKQQTVFIPIFGIAMETPSWDLGKIQLVNVAKQALDRFFSQTHPFVADQLKVGLTHGVYAYHEVEAEPERAKEISFEETRRVIDLLRFLVILKPRHARGRTLIALEEEINLKPANRLITILPQDLRSVQIHWRSDSLDHADWLLTPEFIAEADKGPIGKLSAILKKPYSDVTDYEKGVLRAVHWLANYQFQFERENKLLSLITSLETLFTPRDNNPIGTAIAEAVALVSSEELSERKRVKGRVRELYRHRSAVSHGGHKAVSDADLRELLKITKHAVLWSIDQTEKFKSTRNLFDWLEDRKLSG